MTEKDEKFNQEAYIREIKGLPPEEAASGAGSGDDQGSGGDQGAGSGGSGSGDFITRIESTLKAKDPTYVLPEFLKTGEVNGIKLTDDQITAALAKELEKTKIDDPFLKEYTEAASQQGFNRDEWLKNKLDEQKFLDLKGDDFLRSYYKTVYKDEEGVTDEDIEAELANMTKLSKIQLEKDVKQAFKEQGPRGGSDQIAEPVITDEIVQIQKQIDVGVSVYANTIREKNVIGGFEFAEADRTQFIQELPDFTRKTIREANGRKFVASDADQILTEILINPKAVMDILPYLWLKKHNKLEGFFSSAVERKKEELEKKLATDPKIQRGVTADQGFDKNKFKEDAQK